MPPASPASVDDYIRTFPPKVQATLEDIRRTIRAAVPEADEGINYKMPAYTFHGRLLYFAAYKEHVSVFGTTQGVRRRMQNRLSPYEQAKATLAFPLNQPMPLDLIRDLALAQAEENLVRAAAKA